MNLLYMFSGKITIRIESASGTELIKLVNDSGIMLFNVVQLNELQFEMTLYNRFFKSAAALFHKYGADITIIKRTGVTGAAGGIISRPIILGAVLIMLFLTIFLPTRVLFICVEGNDRVSTYTILEAAEAKGVFFGVSRAKLRSEKVKNGILSVLPDLQWVGVNTKGCVATISVVERAPESQISDSEYGSIFAKCDGVVCSVTVTSGEARCTVGQAVTKNQLLVSGYINCNFSIKLTRAEGEVYAQTLHKLNAVTTPCSSKTMSNSDNTVLYRLRIGKKLINLFKGSGILDTRCVKMYDEYPLVLPGGFSLPITLVKETHITCVNSEHTQTEFDWIETDLTEYLSQQMIAGQIHRSTFTHASTTECYQVFGIYTCSEMIGLFRSEEILTEHE